MHLNSVLFVGITGSAKTSNIRRLNGGEATDLGSKLGSDTQEAYVVSSVDGRVSYLDSPGFLDTGGEAVRRSLFSKLLAYITRHEIMIRKVVLCFPVTGKLLDNLHEWLSDCLIAVGFDGTSWEQLTVCFTQADIQKVIDRNSAKEESFKRSFPGCHIVYTGFGTVGLKHPGVEMLKNDVSYSKLKDLPLLPTLKTFKSSEAINTDLVDFRHQLDVVKALLSSGDVNLMELKKELVKLKKRIEDDKKKGCCSDKESKEALAEISDSIHKLNDRIDAGESTLSSKHKDMKGLESKISDGVNALNSRATMLNLISRLGSI